VACGDVAFVLFGFARYCKISVMSISDRNIQATALVVFKRHGCSPS
jgi:hypothetical protein